MNCRNTFGNLNWKRINRRPRHRCEGNFKMDIEGAECEGMNWGHLAEDTAQSWGFVSLAMKHRVT
jgi:hypothetical protein